MREVFIKRGFRKTYEDGVLIKKEKVKPEQVVEKQEEFVPEEEEVSSEE